MDHETSKLSRQSPQRNSLPPGAALAIGISLGVALGVAFDNLAIGLALGVALGITFGSAARRHNPHAGSSLARRWWPTILGLAVLAGLGSLLLLLLR